MKSPRYIFFCDSGYDFQSSQDGFFTATLSRGGYRLTFVDAPREFGETLGSKLSLSMPRQIASDRALEDRIYVIELNNRYSRADLCYACSDGG